MKSLIVLLNARRYSLIDEKTGQLIQGTKISYLQDFNPVVNANSRGCDVLTSTLPYQVFETLDEIPAYYEAEFVFRPDSKGRPVLAPVSLSYSGPFDERL
jgi:hypothetical protein